MAPSLVTWPTINVAAPVRFAMRVIREVASRIWDMLPFEPEQSAEYIVCMLSIIT